jgi:hypothetical protein
MDDLRIQPILVTGAHRTGTTWVGKTLARTRGLSYISEPLNYNHNPGVLKETVPAWYTYICSDNADQYREMFEDLLEYRYHYRAAFKNTRGIKDVAIMLRDIVQFLFADLQNSTPLIKDPFAVFSVPWLQKEFDLQVVIMIRHPLPFVSSLKRLGWSFDFSHLLDQPLLMNDWLEPYREEMLEQQKFPADIVGQGALLWRIIYSVVYSYHKQNRDLVLVRHEDLSRTPLQGFREVFDQLQLPFTADVQNHIRKTTRSQNPEQLREGNEHAIHLDSRASLHNWQSRLEEEEITRIINHCREELQFFYQPEEWKLW